VGGWKGGTECVDGWFLVEEVPVLRLIENRLFEVGGF
jgi:hypothetical protein